MNYNFLKRLNSMYMRILVCNVLITLFVTDVTNWVFWSEYRVNRKRFHSLSSEFLLYWS